MLFFRVRRHPWHRRGGGRGAPPHTQGQHTANAEQKRQTGRKKKKNKQTKRRPGAATRETNVPCHLCPFVRPRNACSSTTSPSSTDDDVGDGLHTTVAHTHTTHTRADACSPPLLVRLSFPRRACTHTLPPQPATRSVALATPTGTQRAAHRPPTLSPTRPSAVHARAHGSMPRQNPGLRQKVVMCGRLPRRRSDDDGRRTPNEGRREEGRRDEEGRSVGRLVHVCLYPLAHSHSTAIRSKGRSLKLTPPCRSTTSITELLSTTWHTVQR